MTDTMIGRVAKAIAEANGHDYELYPKLSEALARAALQALREPTEAMVWTLYQEGTSDADAAKIIRGYITLIDAALSEGAER